MPTGAGRATVTGAAAAAARRAVGAAVWPRRVPRDVYLYRSAEGPDDLRADELVAAARSTPRDATKGADDDKADSRPLDLARRVRRRAESDPRTAARRGRRAVARVGVRARELAEAARPRGRRAQRRRRRRPGVGRRDRSGGDGQADVQRRCGPLGGRPERGRLVGGQPAVPRAGVRPHPPRAGDRGQGRRDLVHVRDGRRGSGARAGAGGGGRRGRFARRRRRRRAAVPAGGPAGRGAAPRRPGAPRRRGRPPLRRPRTSADRARVDEGDPVPLRHPSQVPRHERSSTMSKLIVSQFITVDGVIEDPGGSEGFERGGWALQFERGPEGDKFKLDELLASDVLLLGRVTYEGFAAAWPSRTGDFAEKFNTMRKYVVSTTLDEPGWNNSTVIRADVAEEVAKLKDEPGGDVLGAGKRLFGDAAGPVAFRPVETKPAGSVAISPSSARMHHLGPRRASSK